MSRINKIRLLTTAAVIVVYAASLLVSPQLAKSWKELLVLTGLVLGGVFTVLPELVRLIWPEEQSSEHLSIQQQGQVNLAVTNSRISGGVHVTTTVATVAPPTPHQLRRPPDNFVGRQAELDELIAAAQQGGVIITGMSGVGKTALALVLADKLKALYSDAHFDIDLYGISPQPYAPKEAMLHVIRAYDPSFRSNEDNEIAGRYRSLLSGKRTLLLLENACDATQVAELIPPDGNLVIITSRTHFALPPLYEKRLLSLSAQDARKFLLTVAPRIGKAADELASLCGYLPLALKTSGVALRERTDLSPSQYIERLHNVAQRLQLTGIAASLRISYDLLTTEQQRRWRVLSVFQGTFHYEGASLVWGLKPQEAQDILGELLGCSLIEHGPVLDMYWLHDLAQAFADTLVSIEESREALKQHALYGLDVLRAADDFYREGGDSIFRALNILDFQRENIKAGQAWAAKNIQQDHDAARMCCGYALPAGTLLSLWLPLSEQIQWLQLALTASRVLNDQSAEMTALCDLGSAFALSNEMERAMALYESSLRIAQALRDQNGELKALGNMANVYMTKDVDRANTLFQQRLRLGQELDDQREVAAAWIGLSDCYRQTGQLSMALEAGEKALGISQVMGDLRSEATALINVGNAHYYSDNKQLALRFYSRTLEIARRIRDSRLVATALHNLASTYLKFGEARDAIEFGQQELQFGHDIGDRIIQFQALGLIADSYRFLKAQDMAIELHEQQLELARDIGDLRKEGEVWNNLGQDHCSKGNASPALECLERARQIAIDTQDYSLEIQVLLHLRSAYLLAGDMHRSLSAGEHMLQVMRQQGVSRGETILLGGLGVGYRMLGKTQQAIEYLNEGLQSARRNSEQSWEGRILQELALTFDQDNDRQRAIAYAEEALAILEGIDDALAEQVRQQLTEWKP